MPFDIITILGPTASGKTSIAAQLAKDFNGEIISADSRQVYKGMDIGTGKDLIEFQKNEVNYYLIDIIEPYEEYNLFRFTKDFQSAFESIIGNGKLPILVGGTGLYISAILQSYNLPEIDDEDESEKLKQLTISQLKEILINLRPKLHNQTDLKSKDRLIKSILIERSRERANSSCSNLQSLNIGINSEREETKKRITERLKQRLTAGMIEEVEELLRKGISSEKLNYFGLEYKFVSQYIDGKLNYNDMFQKLNSAIHNFAKRQMTWFRKMEKEGVVINWFPPDYPAIKNFVNSQLNNAKIIS
ncbi:MAG: tRNA (adenosine(37)-N6)-dimethylallyltransferase MiaA [Ignavibacteria bacterium RBG_16_36_9]|nr:MAG: tRNA (adenosine(37)-N6)-dimethylallyltransferase MiaA [Ignavibacteria bacterium RBG_16_36_9]